MLRLGLLTSAALTAAIPISGCAGWDNPTALADLDPQLEFEIATTRVETLEEVEITVHASESGVPMRMHQSQLEIEHPLSGTSRTVTLEPEGEGFAAHVIFYEEGEHHLHFMGQIEGHTLMAERGDHEIHVYRQHRLIGPYWVELEVTPAPVFEDSTAHLHALVFALQTDGTPGAPVGGLDVQMAVHAPDLSETVLAVSEESAGEYEGSYAFGPAGLYELHLEIDVQGVPEEGEFHIPVRSVTESGTDGHDQGGGGHGH